MTATRAALLTAAAIAVIFPGCSSDQANESKDKPQSAESVALPPEKPITYEDSFSATVTATVKSVDLANRRITLVNSKGVQETLSVGPEVQRLSEVRPDDLIYARYRATLLAELRPPTAQESASPITYVDASGRAPEHRDPSAGAFEAVRIVTTVEAVDVPNLLVTLRGPLGDLAVVKGRNPENVKRIRRGDTIVITFAHALVVSLDKQS